MDTFTRNCPSCGTEIVHKTERGMLRSKDKGNLCGTCARNKTRETCQSKAFRDLKRQQTNAEHVNPKSKFNSQAYHDKLSTSQEKAWIKDGVREKRVVSMKRVWSENYDAHCKAVAASQTPEVRAKATASMLKTLAEHPEISQKRGQKIAELWKTDEAYRAACLPNILTPHRGNTSKAELKLIDVMKVHGFEHSVRMHGFIVDFYNTEKNVVIEYFGDYWHCHKRYHKRFDEQFKGLHPHRKEPYRDMIAEDNAKIVELSKFSTVHILWESDVAKRGIEDILKELGYE